MTKITEAEIKELREKAGKWDDYCASQKARSTSVSPQQRQLNARKAASARWEKYYAAKRLETADATPSPITREETLEVQRRMAVENSTKNL